MPPSICPHVQLAASGAITEDLLRLQKSPKCQECQAEGLNFWLCLYPDCHFVGCSDANGGQDHSTRHNEANPNHPIQMNLTTIRAWCFICNREVHAPILNQFKPKVNKRLESDQDQAYYAQAADQGYDQQRRSSSDQEIRGLVGLSNLGNTCYMNAALQCMSNVPALAEFFLTCSALVSKADIFNGVQRDKPNLSQAFLLLLRELHSSRNGYVAPSKLLFAFKAAHPMFRGYHQQDSQEFLRCFMDQIHDELMEPEHELEDSLESVSEENSEDNTEDEEDEEDHDENDYETADSGVSDSSADKKKPNRKRKLGNESGDNPDSPSSEGEAEFMDAASSRSASPPITLNHHKPSQRSPSKLANPDVKIKRKPKTYRSVISDVFDGKLNSSVQCLTCDRVSTTTETFQDLSLSIPTLEALATSRLGKLSPSSAASSTTSLATSGSSSESGSGWFSWVWSWMSEWFYGPDISLQDCLAYFFSADELKGDNMYSCEKCKKLRNGLKYSRVTVLPETLCIHLKRFRHEFAFSSKISSKVTFPLVDLDMGTWLHQDCISRESKYDLVGVICHHGTAGGGHYTSYALNNQDQEWYEYDDSSVSKVEPSTVLNAEAYVLFYRKNNMKMEAIREEVQSFLDQGPGLLQFYISRQWLNKFENFAEPGPIDNSDFLCRHGGVLPNKVDDVFDLCIAFPQSAWNFLHSTFGGGPACSRLYECSHCKDELDAILTQKTYELETFKKLHAEFQESSTMYCLTSSWFKSWESYVLGRQRDPPGPIDNKSIITTRFNDRIPILRQSADYIRVSQEIWKLFYSTYGGGPEVLLRSNGTSLVVMPKPPLSLKNNLLRTRSASESTVSTTTSCSPKL